MSVVGSVSLFFLEFRVKNVFRIKYLESFIYRFMKNLDICVTVLSLLEMH